jgi:hypothetical protein
MQGPIICFIIISLIILILGFRQSLIRKPAGANHYCTSCGWTKEQVQFCQVEKRHSTTVEPLCFECSIKQEAMPVKALRAGSYAEAFC